MHIYLWHLYMLLWHVEQAYLCVYICNPKWWRIQNCILSSFSFLICTISFICCLMLMWTATCMKWNCFCTTWRRQFYNGEVQVKTLGRNFTKKHGQTNRSSQSTCWNYSNSVFYMMWDREHFMEYTVGLELIVAGAVCSSKSQREFIIGKLNIALERNNKIVLRLMHCL